MNTDTLRVVSFIRLPSLFYVLLSYHEVCRTPSLHSTPSWAGSSSSKVTEWEEDKEKGGNDETEGNTGQHSFTMECAR